MRCPPGTLLGLLFWSASCGTLPNARSWGQDATLAPGWSRVGRAARAAALAPHTWAPLAGAVLLQVDDWDERLSEWAAERNPVFGSQRRALRAGDWTGKAADFAWFGSVLATQSGPEPADWLWWKTKGLLAQGSARGLTILTVDTLKSSVPRERPHGDDDRSFPSEHAARVNVNATLARRNLDSVVWPKPLRTGLQASLYGLEAAGAWCRVEAGAHFPSDVLVGIAIGHFLGQFIDAAFLGLDAQNELGVGPTPDGVALSLKWRF